MSESFKVIIGGALCKGLGTYIEYIVGFFITIILARHLGAYFYGEYTYYIWLSGVIVAVTNNGIIHSAARFIARYDSYGEGPNIYKLFHNYQVVSSLLVVLLMLVYLIVFDVDYTAVVLVIVVASYVKAQYMFNQSVINGYKLFIINSKTLFVVCLSNLIVVTLAICYFDDYVSFIAIYLFVSCLYYFVHKYYSGNIFCETGSGILSNLRIKEINTYTFRDAILTVAGLLVLKQGEVYFIELYSNSKDVAYYRLSFSIATGIVMLLPGLISSVLLPILSSIAEESREVKIAHIKTSHRHMLITLVPVITFGVFYSQQIIELLLGGEYLPASHVLAVAFITASLIQLLSIPTSYFYAVNNQLVVLKTISIGLIVSVSGNLFFTSTYGLHGALLVSFFTVMTMVCILFNKLKDELDFSFDMGFSCRVVMCGLMATTFSLPILMIAPEAQSIFYTTPVFCLSYFTSLFYFRIFKQSEVMVIIDKFKDIKKIESEPPWVTEIIIKRFRYYPDEVNEKHQ